MKIKKSLLLGVSLFLLVAVSCATPNKEKKENSASTAEPIVNVPENPVASTTTPSTTEATTAKESKLKPSLVCFVNNKFMGIDQIPVEVEGKTYYGCCKDCVGKLKNIREIRYSIDPLTGKEVDKALAYIVLDPKGNQDVLYFESEQNYLNYLKR